MSAKRESGQTYTLRFADGWRDPQSYPARMKRLLKLMLRSYGIKAECWTDPPADRAVDGQAGGKAGM